MEDAMKRFAKISLYVGIALVALIVGAAVVLMSMDFNQYKPQIAAEVKKATGRDMAIEGDLRLNLLTFNPGLAVAGVRFANAPWGSRPDMAVIKRFEVKVAILPLLNKTLDVERVVIEGADILVERNAQGQGNYEFLGAEKPAAPAKAPDPGKPESSGTSLPTLAVREVTIKDSRLTYKDAKAAQPLVLALSSLSVAAVPGEPMRLDLKGAYNDAPFTVKGTMGDLAQLLQPSKPWPVKVTAEAGGATVAVDGSVANPTAASGIDIALAVEGKDLSQMSKLAGSPVPPLGPYSLKTKIVGSIDKVVELRDLSARMGDSALAGKAAMQIKDRPTLSATLTSEQINLADFTKGGEVGGKAGSGAPAPAGGTSGAPAQGGGDKRLFPDEPLPVDALKAADANIDVTVKKLIADKSVAENVHAVVALRNGDLTVSPIEADVAKGKLNGMVQLKASQATPTLDVKISGKKVDIGQLLTEMGITDLLYGVVNTDLDLAGSGKSVRQLVASLNGKTNVVMGEGRMKSTAIDTYVGGAATVLTQAVFGKKSEYTVINCFVNQFDIKNGLATSKALLFDTEYAQITGAGTVNLGTEQIKYTVDPKPKSVTVNTAVPVQIGGTLTEPTYRLDPLAAAAKVGGLIGTVLFPPAAVVGLGELGVSDKNPCMKQGTGAQPQQAAPKGPAGALESLGQGVQDKLGKDLKESLDKGLKGLFGK
jgi:uncharacterized protein involved in outer membrane biogenesis